MINQTEKLYNKQDALKFYENRYSNHYMDEWPKEKKDRVFFLIKSLPLPQTGWALDFGCGNGIFTDVIKQALPDWEVYGCDITETSINNARNRFPNCKFFISDDSKSTDLKFDFIFTHHVLEHVYNIEKTLVEIDNYLLPSSSMLHIFPCGNRGSFEWKIANLRTDGINKELGNRFFHEDEGHLRRLSSSEFDELVKPFGFSLQQQFYGHHYYGAIEWITRTTLSTIKSYADPQMAINESAKKELKRLRRQLLIQFFLRFPSSIFIKAKDPTKPSIRYLILALGWLPYIIGLPYYNKLVRKAEKEWHDRKFDKEGGEMYLFHSR